MAKEKSDSLTGGFNRGHCRPIRGLVLLAAVLLAVAVAARGEEASREYQLKAAFVYNFSQFTVWPDKAFSSSDAPFVVGIIGPDPFEGALRGVMEGKKVANHPVVFKHFDSVDEIKGCHLLFVPAAEEEKLNSIFRAVNDSPVLTVGETPAFPAAGGTIRFLIEDNKIRFEVNLDSANKAGLKISSKLLSLAKIYKP